MIIKGRVTCTFKKNFFTCMYSLRNDMYNCMICFLVLNGEKRHSKTLTFALYRLFPDCGFYVTG